MGERVQINVDRFIFYKFYHYNLSLQLQMSMLPSNQRQREGTSPFREKWQNRVPSRISINDLSTHGKETTPQRLKPRHEVSNREFPTNLPTSGKISNHPSYEQQDYDKKLEEKYKLAQLRSKKQHQTYSYIEESQSSLKDRRGKMNDFSFEEEFQHHASHGMSQNQKRENAWMKGLQIKMNNIDSINDKINDLLQLVKKDKSKDRFEVKDTYKKLPENIKSSSALRQTLTDHSVSKQHKENQYSYELSEKDHCQQRDKMGINYEKPRQSPLKYMPLSIKEQNIEQYQVNHETNSQRYQKMINENSGINNQNELYKPLPRRKIEGDRQKDNNNENQKRKQREKNQKSIVQQSHKSIDQLLNERRMQRNKQEKCDNKPQDSQMTTDYAQRNRRCSKFEQNTYSETPEEANTNIYFLEYPRPHSKSKNNIHFERNQKPTYQYQEDMQTNGNSQSFTGRIYKKSEATTPKGSTSTTPKKQLQICLNDF